MDAMPVCKLRFRIFTFVNEALEEACQEKLPSLRIDVKTSRLKISRFQLLGDFVPSSYIAYKGFTPGPLLPDIVLLTYSSFSGS